MVKTAISAALALLFLAACSDKTGSLPDGTGAGDTGPAADTGGDTGGTQTDTGGTKTDTGVTDTGGTQTDTGGTKPDTGGPSACDPSFGPTQACGGTLSGTKWKYTKGCVASAAFDDLKKLCPGVAVSNVAYTMPATNTLQFYANGSLLRVFNGQIKSKGVFPQTCAKLGCPALQSGLKLSLVLYPGSTVTCAAAAAGACSCDVMIQLFAFGGGTYVVSGNTITVTSGGKVYPYYFCRTGSSLSYAGTPSNTVDTNVTYVLSKTN